MEDSQHRSFLLHALRAAGYEHHQLRTRVMPKGAGSGEQFVRESYATEVKALRSRLGGQANVGLLVMIDADIHTVAARKQQLARELTKSGLARRGAAEPVGLLIPRRHIETWLEYLRTSQVVDETKKYKTGKVVSAREEARLFKEWARPNGSMPSTAPDSVKKAIPEWRRVP